jgi:hypothetical protein
MAYRVTQTNGNAKNGIRGSRLTIWAKNGKLIDRFIVPSYNGQQYCKKHPGGKYAKRLQKAIREAEGSY